jgi:hypothetical protein
MFVPFVPFVHSVQSDPNLATRAPRNPSNFGQLLGLCAAQPHNDISLWPVVNEADAHSFDAIMESMAVLTSQRQEAIAFHDLVYRDARNFSSVCSRDDPLCNCLILNICCSGLVQRCFKPCRICVIVTSLVSECIDIVRGFRCWFTIVI